MARKSLMVGLLLAIAVTDPAHAQTMDTESNSWSQAVNQTQVIVPGGGGGGGGKQEVEYSGGYKVRNVPDVVAPMIPGGTNPCVVGMSAGGSVVGFGATMGGSWNDIDCERRNLSIILMNAADKFGDPALATAGIEILCNNREVEQAMELANRPCIRSRDSVPQTASAGYDDGPAYSATARQEQVATDWSWIESTTLGK